MYNLFVSADAESWDGQPFMLEVSRCVREYTDKAITDRLGSFSSEAVSELQKLPCIFAYEAALREPPKFGIIKEIMKRGNQVRIQYEIIKVTPFLSFDDFNSLAFELDTSQWEMNRTHWAVKDVNLAKELRGQGIMLPSWLQGLSRTVDITSHIFDVALSFPGEARALVEPVAIELERIMGPHAYFYDYNYVSQLAQPSLDTLLQGIYGRRSRLIVVFLSGDYQRKQWCGVEFRAIREIIMQQNPGKIMFVRCDDGAVDGVFNTDGYIDARKISSGQIASFIRERVGLL